MNKKKLKKILSLATAACVMSTSLFAMTDSSPETINQKLASAKISGFLNNSVESRMIGEFLSAEDLDAMNNTSKGVRVTVAIPSYCEQYAQCIVNDQPVPRKIKDILTHLTDSKEKKNAEQNIAKEILNDSKGLFFRSKPLPPFLIPFFKAAPLINLNENALNQDIHPAIALHMKMRGSFWVKNEGFNWRINSEDSSLTKNKKKAYAESLITKPEEFYINLVDAFKLSEEGATIPKNIIITAREIYTRAHHNAMNILLTRHPNHELVVYFKPTEVSNPFIWKAIYQYNVPSSLRNISIVGENLTTIGEYFLNSCFSVTTVTIPNSVTTIGDKFLNCCRSVTTVTLPNSVTTIGNKFLNDCSSVTTVTLPNSVTTIGDKFLYGCSALTTVTIPNSVTTIGDDFINECSALTTVTIPNSVTTIGDYFLNYCSSLITFTLPNSVTTIGNKFLYGCSALTTVTIPNSVTTIGDDFINECSALTTVTIPNSVTTIGDYFLNYCSSLITVTIPERFKGSSAVRFLSKEVEIIFT